MTEAEWLACTDPEPMLKFLQGNVSDRKLRLFTGACFRQLITLLPDPRQRRGIEVLEQLAEGTVTREVFRSVGAEVRQAVPRHEWVFGTDNLNFIALMLDREFCSSSLAIHAVHATAGLADGAEVQYQQAQLLRDIFGPHPLRPVALDPSWLTWHGGTVPQLAQSVYDDRHLPSGHLDNHRLAVLADALEDAGCTDPDILGHCRGPGPHVRGCWVVDLLLGKE
jgi:hypothetical protein